jgi:hypothetical protein
MAVRTWSEKPFIGFSFAQDQRPLRALFLYPEKEQICRLKKSYILRMSQAP